MIEALSDSVLQRACLEQQWGLLLQMHTSRAQRPATRSATSPATAVGTAWSYIKLPLVLKSGRLRAGLLFHNNQANRKEKHQKTHTHLLFADTRASTPHCIPWLIVGSNNTSQTAVHPRPNHPPCKNTSTGQKDMIEYQDTYCRHKNSKESSVFGDRCASHVRSKTHTGQNMLA